MWPLPLPDLIRASLNIFLIDGARDCTPRYLEMTPDILACYLYLGVNPAHQGDIDP